MIRITDEAVAAAAREFFGRAYGAVGDEGNKVLHDGAREALEAALPHLEGATPAIDREALLQVVAEYIDDLDAIPPMGTGAEHLERRAVHVTDAVIAHLGGTS